MTMSANPQPSMTREQVIALLRTSTTPTEWDANCDIIKKAHNGGYPSWWYGVVIQSGLMDQILGPGASQIKIVK